MNIVHIDDLESIPVGDRGLEWRPIRSRFGITAFGTNAYTANVGSEIVEEHSEERLGHEEMYVVVTGRATFTLDGDEVDAPAGTIVHVPDPKVRRMAIATEPETRVLAVGGKPGEAFRPSAWELWFHGSKMEPAEAVAYVEERMGEYDESVSLRYNLACFKALAGDREGALGELARAYEMEPERVREWAASDPDLESVRGDPRFPVRS